MVKIICESLIIIGIVMMWLFVIAVLVMPLIIFGLWLTRELRFRATIGIVRARLGERDLASRCHKRRKPWVSLVKRGKVGSMVLGGQLVTPRKQLLRKWSSF